MPGVRVGVLDQLSDFHACVELQEATWGRGSETVPVSMLAAATKVGGLVIGAVDVHGVLIGFAFGLAGFDTGGPLHWSHMLAVRLEARGGGIGRLLKESQRATLAERGVTRIGWTFDPLQARNAHLNINRLGARIVEYVEDMYGVTRSPLHMGLATDRLVAMTAAPNAALRAAPGAEPWGAEEVSTLEIHTLTAESAPGPHEPTGDRALVEIPWDIETILANDLALAARWRGATRRHFQQLLSRGYAVDGFIREPSPRRAFYRFNRVFGARATVP